MQINPIKAVKNLFQIFIRLHRCTRAFIMCKENRALMRIGSDAEIWVECLMVLICQ